MKLFYISVYCQIRYKIIEEKKGGKRWEIKTEQPYMGKKNPEKNEIN